MGVITGTADDAMTLEEYQRLSNTDAQRNGARTAQTGPRVSPPAATPRKRRGEDGAPDAVRLCEHCRQPLGPEADSRAHYCSAGCRVAAKRAREREATKRARTRARAAAVGNGAGARTPAGVVDAGSPSPTAGEEPVRNRTPEPEPSDGVADLVVALVARGVDVQLESGAWRLTVHPGG